MSRLPAGRYDTVCKSDSDIGSMENAKEKCVDGVDNEKPEGRVLVLYTGGTIGMMRNEQGSK